VGKLEDIAGTLRSRKRLPFDGKSWTPAKLIVHLVKEVRHLRKTQCMPGVHCIFKYDEYLDGVYGTDSGDQPVPHPRGQRKTTFQTDFPIYTESDED